MGCVSAAVFDGGVRVGVKKRRDWRLGVCVMVAWKVLLVRWARRRVRGEEERWCRMENRSSGRERTR